MSLFDAVFGDHPIWGKHLTGQQFFYTEVHPEVDNPLQGMGDIIIEDVKLTDVEQAIIDGDIIFV